MMQRPPLLHVSALSPREHESWAPLISELVQEASSSLSGVAQGTSKAADGPTVQTVWEVIKKRLEDSVDKSTEDDILYFFRGVAFSHDLPGLIYALLRLASHSRSSRLARDHAFIQCQLPLALAASTSAGAAPEQLASPLDLPTGSRINPFRRSFASSSAVSDQSSSAGASGTTAHSPTFTARSSASTVSSLIAGLAPSSSTPQPPKPGPKPKLSLQSPVVDAPQGGGNNPFRRASPAGTQSTAAALAALTASPEPLSTRRPSAAASSSSSNSSTKGGAPGGKATSDWASLASPPLPPRPSFSSSSPSPRKSSDGTKSEPPSLPSSSSAAAGGSRPWGDLSTPLPPPPSRRVPSTSTTSAAAASKRMSSIGSSPPLIRPPATKLVASSHIGVATQLRSNSAGPALAATAVGGGLERSSSRDAPGASISYHPIGSPRKSGETTLEQHTGSSVSSSTTIGGATGLGRSKTLGARPTPPPPPPQRRTSSSVDPFADSTARAAGSSGGHSRAVSLSDRLSRALPPLSLESSGTKTKELKALGKEMGLALQQGGRNGEGWIRGKVESRHGSRRERERLVDDGDGGGAEDDDEEEESDEESEDEGPEDFEPPSRRPKQNVGGAGTARAVDGLGLSGVTAGSAAAAGSAGGKGTESNGMTMASGYQKLD